MNILISGDLTSLAGTFARKFSHEKNKVILASNYSENTYANNSDAVFHPINPTDPLFSQVLASYRFDTVIYLAPREEQLLLGEDNNSGKLLDGLRNTLELCRRDKVKWFFYISSTEIYGDKKNTAEDAEPHPNSLNGFVLYAGEQFCKMYHQKYDLNTSVIRIPFVYGDQEKNSLMFDILKSGFEKKQITFPGGKDAVCSFLHVDDIANFIQRALDEEYNPDDASFINLVSSDQFACSDLQDIIEPYYPKTKFFYTETKSLHTRSVKMQKAKQYFDWIAEHDLKTELPLIIDVISNTIVEKPRLLAKVKDKFSKKPGILKWVELFVGAGLMHFLNYFTGTLVQFKLVDFRLLFVVLLGSVHGLRFGLLAAVLASASILYSWFLSGLDWALLVFNVENWLPISMYITIGAITGYVHDKKENEIAFQNQQNDLVHEKYDFLYGIYQDITKIKNKFREQLLGYRDSFGRIFNVSQELETYQEDDIFLKALEILEEFLDNKNIALYTLNEKSEFARLTVNSQPLQNKIGKSLNLASIPKVLTAIEKRSIYQNTALDAKYPAYVAPIYNNGLAVALIVIWKAGFDQFSMYYYNLIKVIRGLIQSSLAHASIYLDSNRDEMYISSTKILKPEFFKETLRVRMQMRNNRIADFLLLKLEPKKGDWPAYYQKIQKGIRTTDHIGTADNGDCYIVLSQANPINVETVIKRLSDLNIKSKLVEESEILYV